jgi:hypothetical protein
MPNLDDAKSEALYCMFKGEPGTRKSTAALSFPKPIYYFDVDQKISSLLIPAKKWGISNSEIDYDSYNDFNAIDKKLEQLQLNCKYKTIVVDSITSVGDATNRQTRNLKSGTTTKDGAEKGNRIGGIAVNSLEDYKAENAAFDQLISRTKDICKFHRCNIILIAHVIGERAQKDRSNITHFARIIITGGKAISGKLPAYCQEVYHFNVEPSPVVTDPPSFGLFTVHTGDDFARTSLPLDSKIVFDDRPLYDTYLLPAINSR